MQQVCKVKTCCDGQYLFPRRFKGIHFSLVCYYPNKKTWITRDIFCDWFHKSFVPTACACCRKADLDENFVTPLHLSFSSSC